MANPRKITKFITTSDTLPVYDGRIRTADPISGNMSIRFGRLGTWKVEPVKSKRHPMYRLTRVVPSERRAENLRLKLVDKNVEFTTEVLESSSGLG